MNNKSIRDYIDLIENAQNSVAEGLISLQKMEKLQMNELINNLRLDAGISQLKDDPRLVVIDREGNVIDPLIGLEKFAELIIQECMRMCEVTEMSFVTHDCDVEASGAITVKQFIAEHFGVEE